MDAERRRFLALLDEQELPADAPELLRTLARRVDDLRFGAAS